MFTYSYYTPLKFNFSKRSNQYINQLLSETKVPYYLNKETLIWKWNKFNYLLNINRKFVKNRKKKIKPWWVLKKLKWKKHWNKKRKNKWPRFKVNLKKFNFLFLVKSFVHFFRIWKPNIFNRRNKQLKTRIVTIWKDKLYKRKKLKATTLFFKFKQPRAHISKYRFDKKKWMWKILKKKWWWFQNRLFYMIFFKRLRWGYYNNLWWLYLYYFLFKNLIYKKYENIQYFLNSYYNYTQNNKKYNLYYFTYKFIYNKLRFNSYNNYYLLNYSLKLWQKEHKNSNFLKVIKVNWFRNFIDLFRRKFKLFWRKHLILNLILIYLIIFQYKRFIDIARIFGNYATVQLRIIFKKHDQRRFFVLILKLNKFFINKKFYFFKYYNFNTLEACMIIITGRWQRKRWVGSFPKRYREGLVIRAKHHHFDYWYSFFQGDIYNKKGNIGFRIFFIGNQVLR